MNIALFGGTGFVGNYLISELISRGFSPRILVREGSESKIIHDCDVICGDISNKGSVQETITGTKAIIYNIGIIREFPSYGMTYRKLHFEGVRMCIQIAKKMDIKRFILMSANGVKLDGTGYQRSKLQAERELQKSNLDWTIFRPSLIFGKPYNATQKEFCTQLRDKMLSLPLPSPLFYQGILPKNAGTFSMSPIHVKNVSEFFVKSINKKECIRKIYNIGGLETVEWKEIIRKIAVACRKSSLSVPAPVIFVKFAAYLLDRFRWFPITRDQLTMLMEGNVINEEYFSDFDIDPIKFEGKNLTYLIK